MKKANLQQLTGLQHGVRARGRTLYFNFLFILLSVFSSLAALAQGPYTNTSLEDRVRHTLRQSSKRFQLIENKGQEGLPQEVVAYFTTGTQVVFIEKTRLRVMVIKRENEKQTNTRQNIRSLEEEMKTNPGLTDAYRYNSFVITFENAPGFSSFEKGEQWGPVHNFIGKRTGSSQATIAEGYAEITLKNIYKDIDLRLYSQDNGQLEFDWISWPGADPSAIRMQFSGQQKLQITREGNLDIGLGMGSFGMHLPESYFVTPAGKKRTDIRFTRKGNTVGFRTSKNKSGYPLVIDPDLLWGTFFDGGHSTFDEYLFGITLNEANQLLYCAGAANLQVSTAYAAALSGAWDSTFNGSKDVLVYALTKNGEIVKFITYLGGTGSELATGVAVSSSGIYVSGQTTSLDFPITDGTNGTTLAFDSSYGGNTDGFIAVFNDSLNQLYYTSYLGGPGLDQALTVRTRGDSSYYISLYLEDSISINDSVHYFVNTADSLFAGSSEAWIGRFSKLRNLDFGTYIGDTLDDVVNDFQVLSDGDVMFTGTTRYVPEVRASVTDMGGKEVLFGRIDVTDTAAVSFSLIEMIGGTKTDQGWGLYCLGDSASVIVGQTNSTNFPIGAGGVFQSTPKGNYDGFVARINNDGTSNYKGTYTGGSDDDIFVSVRPIIVLGQPVLLCFGTTQSNDLVVRNYNAGSFYSGFNSGGLDMMFLICDQDLSFKYYLSYIGGDQNDYLGQTGAPIGSNHVFFNEGDSVIYVGTTTHSNQTTHSPLFVGRGPADVDNIGVPVFDKTKGNSNNDTHVIIAISTKALQILPLEWLAMEVQMNDVCHPIVSWQTASEKNISGFIIQRSTDGRNFTDAGQLPAGNGHYVFTDVAASTNKSVFYYRVKAVSPEGHVSFSQVQSLSNCNAKDHSLAVYPTIANTSVTLTGIKAMNAEPLRAVLYDATGKKVQEWSVPVQSPSHHLEFRSGMNTGVYILVVSGNDTPLLRSRIVVTK